MGTLHRGTGRVTVWGVLVLIVTLCQITEPYAQELEEIVVTAQRRTQSLQDVPISIQTFQGDDISRQGFHTLNELTTFSPGLVIKDQSEEQGLLLRSAGTQSKNMGIEAGVPIFVDGVHMGRGSQLKGGLMDVEAVEVLKGPQPVYFGQNASAGALLLRSRRPGETWEANLAGEYGNFGLKILEGAIGGPVNDTFGIRVAAKYYGLEGFMRDWWTGDRFPQRESKTIRGTLQWNPTENFQAILKGEYQYNNLGPQVNPIVLDKFYETPKLEHPERVVLLGISTNNIPGVDQEVGEWTNLGYKYGPTYLNPRHEAQISGIPLTESNQGAIGTVFDYTECQKNGGLMVDPGDVVELTENGSARADRCDLTDKSESWPYHALLDLTYVLGNGIEINSLSAFASQEFYMSPGNSGGGAFNPNVRLRGEDFSQWNTELRVSSPAGGQFEWMAGMYYQINDLDYWSDNYRMDGQRPVIAVRASDDSEWLSAFATVTYNFLDNRASLDVGARYSDISKKGRGFNTIAEWYVRNEISDGGDGSIVRVPFGLDVRGSSNRAVDSRAFINTYPGIVNGSIVGRSAFSNDCESFQATTPIRGSSVFRAQTCADSSGEISENSIDPQIVLRYRPNDDVSLYGKYATAFKAGGFDLGVAQITDDERIFGYGPENYEIFEMGARGMLMGGRLATEATLYYMDMTGIQISYISREHDRNITNNVGRQDVMGLELSARYAASDRLRLGGYLSLMKGEIVEFNDAVCTNDEIVANLCRTAADSIAEIGDTSLSGTINRSGVEARNAPDWQFTANARYDLPTLVRGLYSNIDMNLMASDDYITNRNFSAMASMDKHVDANASLEIGGVEQGWSLTFYARNLFAPKPTYYPELDLDGEGILSGSDAEIGMNSFTTYGMRMRYNFF